MVPFADNINHENVDTGFDCVDIDKKFHDIIAQYHNKDSTVDASDTSVNEKSESLWSLNAMKVQSEEEELDKKRKFQEEQYAYMTQLKTEMLECEINLRRKMAEEGLQT
jgi:hypothetical protein